MGPIWEVDMGLLRTGRWDWYGGIIHVFVDKCSINYCIVSRSRGGAERSV